LGLLEAQGRKRNRKQPRSGNAGRNFRCTAVEHFFPTRSLKYRDGTGIKKSEGIVAQFTEKAIIDSFVKLLNERPLDKITVKDIVEDCGINRNTFYYHYEDILALLKAVLNMEAQKAFSGQEIMESWEEGFIAASRFALENKRLVYHIYNSARREEAERYLNYIAGEVMRRYMGTVAADIRSSEEDRKLLEVFYRSALVGMIRDWLDGGMKSDPERMIRRLGLMLKDNIRIALGRVDAGNGGL